MPILLMLAAQALAPPGPPPPVNGTRSYQGIDALARIMEGVWVGTRDHGNGTLIPVTWRIGRFGKGADQLLIGEIEHDGEPRVPAFTGDDPHDLTIITFDAERGGYRAYHPGYYSLRATPMRGFDEQAAIQITSTGLNWTMPVDSNRSRTITIDGDHLTEALVYRDDQPIYRTTMTRTPTKAVWGGTAP